jgi:Trypsin-co-occurring domain 2
VAEKSGVIGLSEALIALRKELLDAWQEGEGEGRRLRFRVPEPIELTFQVAATKEAKADGGVRWWIVSLGGEVSRSGVHTQTIHMKVAPVMYDPETGMETDEIQIGSSR